MPTLILKKIRIRNYVHIKRACFKRTICNAFFSISSKNLTLRLCLCVSINVSAVKQTLAPVAKGVQVVSQAPLTAAQKIKLKEAGGGTFRFVKHSDKYQCPSNTGLQIVSIQGVLEVLVSIFYIFKNLLRATTSNFFNNRLMRQVLLWLIHY